jgi:hypothetical protein
MNLWQDGSEVRPLRARLGLDSGYFSRQLRRLEVDRLAAAGLSGYRHGRR